FAERSVCRGKCPIHHLDVQFVHSFDLKYAFGRPHRKHCEVRPACTSREMDSVQAAHDVSETEISDQPVCDSVPHDRSQWSFQIQFQSVSVFESANSQCARLIASQTFETNKSLFQKNPNGRDSLVGNAVSSAETQLTLGSRCDRIGR